MTDRKIATLADMMQASVEAGLSVPPPPRELRADSKEAQKATALRLLERPIPEELRGEITRHSNFKMKRYTLFAVPGLMIYLQGPIRGLPNKEDWRDYFTTPDILKTKPQPYPKGTVLTEKAIELLASLTEPYQIAKLYNDLEWHRALVHQLTAEGLSLNKDLVANKTSVELVVNEYWEGLNYWLISQGYRDLAHWERQTLANGTKTILKGKVKNSDMNL